jgi:hypothetical protein
MNWMGQRRAERDEGRNAAPSKGAPLLEGLCGEHRPGHKNKYKRISDESLVKMASRFSGINECQQKNESLWNELKLRGLVYRAYREDFEGRGKYRHTDDSALLGLAGLFPGRSDCSRNNLTLYHELTRRKLVEKAFGDPLYCWKRGRKYSVNSDAELVGLGREFSSRSDCQRENPTLYGMLNERNLLDKTYGPKKSARYSEKSDAQLVAMGKAYHNRSECFRRDARLYNRLKERDLLDDTFGPDPRRIAKLEEMGDEELARINTRIHEEIRRRVSTKSCKFGRE